MWIINYNNISANTWCASYFDETTLEKQAMTTTYLHISLSDTWTGNDATREHIHHERYKWNTQFHWNFLVLFIIVTKINIGWSIEFNVTKDQKKRAERFTTDCSTSERRSNGKLYCDYRMFIRVYCGRGNRRDNIICSHKNNNNNMIYRYLSLFTSEWQQYFSFPNESTTNNNKQVSRVCS